MSRKIKCSYEDCYRHFDSEKTMKKHKAKDRDHDFYCKRCDLDCNDDVELLLHQITSQRHIACPVCGKEFKSESGRDRHVEIDHVPRQKLACVGCQGNFSSASSLMAHIERDECKVIRLEHFQRQRAEKQITQDAWDAALDPTAGATVLSNARSYAAADNEMNLLDDDRAFVNTDWQGRPQYDEDNEHNGPYVDPPSGQMLNLSIDGFPSLGPETRSQPDRLPLITDDSPDLVNLEQEAPTKQPAETNAWTLGNNAWMTGSTSASRLFPRPASDTQSSRGAKPTQDSKVSSVNLLDTFTDDDFLNHDSGRQSQMSSQTSKPSSLQPQASSTRPPLASKPPNLDPNFPFTQIKTTSTHPIVPPSQLHPSTFFDQVLNKYVCPSQTCGAHFTTPQAFSAHLLSAPHVGNEVVCPSCFKRFKTTTSLIAHCESGSRRCRIREAVDFDRVIRQITAGLIAVDGLTEEGSVKYTAQKVEDW